MFISMKNWYRNIILKDMLILSIKKNIILVIAFIAILQAIEVSYVPFIASKAEQFARCLYTKNTKEIIERTCTQSKE